MMQLISVHTPLFLRTYRGLEDNPILAGVAHSATGEPCSADVIAYHVATPGIEPQRDVIVCCDGNGSVLGFAWVQISNVEGVRVGRLESHVPKALPEWVLVSRELLLWSARRMQDEFETSSHDVALIERVSDDDMRRREFLEDAGFRVIRYYHIMQLDHPQLVEERLLLAGHCYMHGPGREGAAEYAAMHNETWIDHYGFSPLSPDDILHDIELDPEYDPDLDIVVMAPDKRYVGFAYCRLKPEDKSLGEVMAIGIRRGSRGQGLGRVLLRHAIRCLIEKGATRIELTVDTESPTGAGRLYESLGFRVVSMKRRYQLDREGIIRLATSGTC